MRSSYFVNFLVIFYLTQYYFYIITCVYLADEQVYIICPMYHHVVHCWYMSSSTDVVSSLLCMRWQLILGNRFRSWLDRQEAVLEDLEPRFLKQGRRDMNTHRPLPPPPSPPLSSHTNTPITTVTVVLGS